MEEEPVAVGQDADEITTEELSETEKEVSNLETKIDQLEQII